MPLYEYECEICKERFVVLVRGPEDKKNVVCPKCASHSIKKLFSSFSAVNSNNSKSSSSPDPCSCGGPC